MIFYAKVFSVQIEFIAEQSDVLYEGSLVRIFRS